MYKIGVDVGSTYTKYCVMNNGQIVSLFKEKTPVRQMEYFDKKISELKLSFPEAEIVSCGYGRKNIDAVRNINELTALAKGAYFISNKNGAVLDIGGQDTKVIVQQKGQLKEFFINDKCAAGSGMFLINTLKLLNMEDKNISLNSGKSELKLSSVCAVFAQSEIVELIANNVQEDKIINAVMYQILVKAKPLLAKIQEECFILSGGMTQINGIANFATEVTQKKCVAMKDGVYTSAIGCSL